MNSLCRVFLILFGVERRIALPYWKKTFTAIILFVRYLCILMDYTALLAPSWKHVPKHIIICRIKTLFYLWSWENKAFHIKRQFKIKWSPILCVALLVFDNHTLSFLIISSKALLIPVPAPVSSSLNASTRLWKSSIYMKIREILKFINKCESSNHSEIHGIGTIIIM